jgi:hypothetical protein
MKTPPVFRIIRRILSLYYYTPDTGPAQLKSTVICGTGGIDIFPAWGAKIGEGPQFCLSRQESGQAEEAYTLGR